MGASSSHGPFGIANCQRHSSIISRRGACNPTQQAGPGATSGLTAVRLERGRKSADALGVTPEKPENEAAPPSGAESERGREAPIEQRLLEQMARQAAVADLGQQALKGIGLTPLLDQAVSLVVDSLDLDFCQVWELLPAGERLLLRAGAGWDPQMIGTLSVPVETASQPGYTMAVDNGIVVQNVDLESRFAPPTFLRDKGVVSGLSVTIPGPDQAFGVLGGHSRQRRTFAPEDLAFLQSVSNVLAAAIERHRSEDEVRRSALQDPLTGLPNRALLLERLSHLTHGRREAARLAILFLDLDRFKLINDTLGHTVGDRLLVAVAGRLNSAIRGSDTLTRFGGDEFVVLCEQIRDESEAIALAERAAAAFSDPFVIDGDEHHITASIGVAVSDARHDRAEQLMSEADAAMYRAKRHGRGSYELFDESMLASAVGQLRIETALRAAIERDELSLVYQPVVTLGDGRMAAVEALLRWAHPELGVISPADFIPIAEESGQITKIGEWALATACRQGAAWSAAHPDGASIPVLVNLSPKQVTDGRLIETVAAALRESGLPPELLGLEITEGVLMEEVQSPVDTLAALNALGVRIVLDDFGTGYSSLSYLKRFPIDILKIDQSFVGGLHSGGHESAIVSAIVALSDALGIEVIAEGVETLEQLRHLRSLGTSSGQGYLFSPPVSAEVIGQMMIESITWPPVVLEEVKDSPFAPIALHNR